MGAPPLCRVDTSSKRQDPSAPAMYLPRSSTPSTALSSIASRASNETLNSNTDSRRSSHGFDALLRATAYAALSSQPGSEHLSRQSTRSSQSPIYYNSCEQPRLSLPPLKAVLGDSLASPPLSPRAQSTLLQPYPCEPAYANQTYKPPSLYPSVKLRGDPDDARVGLSSEGNNHSRGAGKSVSPTRDVPYRPSMRGGDSHVQVQQTRSFASHVPTPFQHHKDIEYNHSDYYRQHGRSGEVNSHYTLEPTSGYNHSAVPRHDVLRVYNGSDSPYPNYRNRSYGSGNDGNYGQKQTQHHLMQLNRGMYEQNSGFMGDNYDYQQNKARKRSNLPKQSTEIMKDWFDKNIDNPYPSEEQKAYFSSATGISMTQVSNWFINHRRRCPELREKRGKHRGTSDDTS